jgi:hypothetical protein
MGLDMYLRVDKSGYEYDFSKPAEKKVYAEVRKSLGIPADKKFEAPSAHVSLNVAYWRKANAIHGWFVRECQGGKDECQESYVSVEKLKELRGRCERVLKDRTQAPELLPTEGGFFFGSTDYDENYMEDLKLTVEQLDYILKTFVGEGFSFYYQSSW